MFARVRVRILVPIRRYMYRYILCVYVYNVRMYFVLFLTNQWWEEKRAKQRLISTMLYKGKCR